MKLKLSIILLFFFFSFDKIYAQLEKGDHFSSPPTIGLSYSVEGPNKSYQLSQTVSYSRSTMASNSVLLGMGLTVTNSATRRQLTSQNITNVNPHLSFEITGLLRYYFNTGKWAPYLFSSTSYWKRVYRKSRYYLNETNEELLTGTSIPDDSESRFNVDLGFGLNYFFTPSVALECNLGFIAFRKASLNINPSSFYAENRLYLNSSLVFLFKSEKEKTSVPLKDRYLKAGNLLVSGNLYKSRSVKKDSEYKRNSNSLNMQANYFLGSRTVAISKISFFKNSINSNGMTFLNAQLILGIGAKHFFPLSNNLFLSLKGELITSTSRDNSEEQTRYTFLPIAVDFNYFKKQTRYYFGSEYRQDSFTFIRNKSNSKRKNLDIYAGFEYFFRPSFYLRSQLTSAMYTDLLDEERKLPKLIDNLKWLRFSMSFGFMIN